ncbi:hypothetical protein N9R43_01830 [bacterium]|nr:hypothetical protein [bacterium]
MAINYNSIAEKTMKIIQGYGFQVKMFDSSNGKSVADPSEARYFYVDNPNLMVHLQDKSEEIKLHLGETTDIDDERISQLIKTMRTIARTNMIDFDIRTFGKHIEPKNYAYEIEKNKEQTMSDVFNEGLSPLEGSTRTSRQTLENVKLIVKHRNPVNEEQRGSRSRNISAIFIENADGERFKYPHKHLNGARAMARHVAHGGTPSDMVGEAIIEQSTSLSKLKEFMHVVNKQGLVNEGNRSIVANVKQKMESIKESIKRIQGAKGYTTFVESLALNEAGDEKMVCKDCGDEKGKPTSDCEHDCHDDTGSHWVKKSELSEDSMNDYVSKFTKSTFEESLKDILPLIHKVNEEQTESNRGDLVARVTEIISAVDKATGEKKNTISFKAPSGDGYDFDQVKNRYAKPQNTAQAAEQKMSMIALQFDDIAKRIDVDTTDDKKRKNKGHDRAAELSNFLNDFASEVRENPKGLDKEKVALAGHLLKLSKQTAESVAETTSIDDKFDAMLGEAFSKYDI